MEGDAPQPSLEALSQASPEAPAEAPTETQAAAPVEPPPAPNPATRPSWPRWGWLPLIIGVGFVLRALYTLWLHPVGDFLYSDMGGHYHAGQAFADPHHVFTKWDIIKPRAMGFVGGFILRNFKGAGLQVWGFFQVLLSTATLPLTYVFVRRFFGARTALFATGFLAINYLPIGFAAYLMTETYLMFCLALSATLLVPESPLLCLFSGVALGVGCLFKPQGLTILPLWGLVLLFWPRAGQPRRSFLSWLLAPQRLSAVLLAVGVACAVIPESIGVSRINGHPTFLTPYGGQNFYIGHCNVRLMTMDGGREGSFFAGVPKVYQRDEPWPDVTFHVSVFDSAFYVKEGMKCFRQSFWASALWSLEQLADVFAGWPGSTIDPWPIPQGWNSITRPFNLLIGYVFFPAALVTLWRRRKERGTWLGFGAPMASIWGLAVAFSGDPRYREPFDLFVIAGGSWTLLHLWDTWALPRIAGELARRGLRPATPQVTASTGSPDPASSSDDAPLTPHSEMGGGALP